MCVCAVVVVVVVVFVVVVVVYTYLLCSTDCHLPHKNCNFLCRRAEMAYTAPVFFTCSIHCYF